MVEVLIASTMALVVLGALISVYLSGQKIQRTARESYYLSQDSSIAISRICDELRQTSLSSIVVRDDGCSFLSAHDLNSDSGFEVTEFGAPRWKKIVHYKVEPVAGKRTSRLIRWEEPTSGRPVPEPIKPPDSPNSDSNVLLTNLLPVNRAVAQRSDGVFEMVDDAQSAGGFQLRFVRQGEDLSIHNPAEFSDEERPGWTADNTELVQLELLVVDEPTDSKLACLKLHRRIKPRHH